MIEFRQVFKSYRSWRGVLHPALSDVTFSVTKGEVVGFVGENGAGKSTAIKILLGLIKPSRGAASLNGMPVDDANARRSVGYVPETASLHDSFTPLEIVRFSSNFRPTGADKRFGVDDVLSRLGLTSVADKRIRSLSKGLAQRAAIAQALVGCPEALILDEPLSGLDPSGRAEVVELLAEYKAAGGTIFFSSHVLHDVERLADRVVFIHKGTVRDTIILTDFLSAAAESYSVRYAAGVALAGSVMHRPGVYSCSISADTLGSAIGEILALGGRILEVKPATSLEQAFLKMIRS